MNLPSKKLFASSMIYITEYFLNAGNWQYSKTNLRDMYMVNVFFTSTQSAVINQTVLKIVF